MTRLDPMARDEHGGTAPAPPVRSSARTRDPRRRLGAFYTPPTTARVMTEWVLRSPSDRILEPSFGDGSFLSALAVEAAARAWPDVRIVGVEIDERPYRDALTGGLIAPGQALHDDFLMVEPFPVDAVLGNPPFVRLRHLPRPQRERALRCTEEVLGSPMESSGSVWMPFLLHAVQFLRPGGRLALVLPHELTYVRYARPLWAYLGATFGRLTVFRAHDRLFPGVLQEAVVLLADGKGRTTASVELKAFETIGDLGDDRPTAVGDVALDRVVRGERAFLEALLSRPLQELLSGKVRDLTRPVGDFARFRIGYVTGDKDFFHPPADVARQYDLPEGSLLATVTSTRRLSGSGLFTSSLTPDQRERLFLPRTPEMLSLGEAKYVELGRERGVHRRYKCRIRQPWFVVPPVDVPDFILTVFCRLPLLLLNDAGLTASNSMLCGYLKAGVDPVRFAAAWYTSLTVLQSELHFHSLGGGVFVVVPGEVRNLRMPVGPGRPSHLRELSRSLAAAQVEDAYRSGDLKMLPSLGFTPQEISLMQEGAATLLRWRSRPNSGPSRTERPETLS